MEKWQTNVRGGLSCHFSMTVMEKWQTVGAAWAIRHFSMRRAAPSLSLLFVNQATANHPNGNPRDQLAPEPE